MTVERIPVLMYHRVGTANNDWERKYCVSPKQFASHMGTLARSGWRAIALHEFFDWLDGKLRFSTPVFLLTFDDGFLGIHEHAAPILADRKWPATVFLVTELLGRSDEWSAHQNPSAATYSLMSAEHIRDLRRHQISFQSHTRSHPDLLTLDERGLRDQLAGSRADLQALLGESVDYLAYPFGRYNGRVIAAAQDAGYRAAFSVQPGFNRHDIDRFRLRRLDVFGTDTAAALKRKITLGSNDGSLGASVRYGIDRIKSRLGVVPSGSDGAAS